MVVVNNLTIRTHNKTILKNVSCTLMPGKVTVFLGKSGVGKTTLLKSIVGLMPLSEGSVTSNGQNIADLSLQERSERIGYVFQQFNLFPHFTVLQNCTDPLVMRGMEKAQAHERALSLLKTLGLIEKINSYPCHLSGGQQQRTALARALCLNPQVILFDEPTASLDPANTNLLISLIQSLKNQGLTIGISTHDMTFAKAVFDRAYLLEDGAIIEECCSPEAAKNSPLLQGLLT